MNNRQVLQRFAQKLPARAPNLHTDGVRLWSYALCVAKHAARGRVDVLADHLIRKPWGGNSVTSKRHVYALPSVCGAAGLRTRRVESL